MRRLVTPPVLALLAGAAMPLGFAPFGQSWVPFLGLAVFLLFCRSLPPRRAAVAGYLFGLGLWGGGIYWVHISIHDFGHVPMLESILLSVLFIAFMASFQALAAWLAARWLSARGAVGWPAVLGPVLAWSLVEWFRGWFLTGFPWLAVGYSQIDTPLAALGPIFGVYGIGLFTVLVAACLLEAGLSVRRAPRRAGVWSIAAGALYLSPMTLDGLHWTEPHGEPIRVSLVQGNIPQDIKWLPSMQAPTLELYLGLTERHWDSDLIVWPESAVPLFLHEARPFIDALASQAACDGHARRHRQ